MNKSAISIFVILALPLFFFTQCAQDSSSSDSEKKSNLVEAEAEKTSIGMSYVPPDSNIFEQPNVIQGWVDDFNIDAIEAHAWDLWGGITALTDQDYPGVCVAKKDGIKQVKLANFITWWSEYDVFNAPGTFNPSSDDNSEDGNCPNPIFPFHSPRQASSAPGQNTPDAHPGDVLSFNKYTQEFKDYVSDNKLYYLKTLTDLYNNKVEQIPKTFEPKKSMMLKPSFIFAAKEKPVLVPYWNGPGMEVTGTTDRDKPVSSTWTQWVLFNPTGNTIEPGTPFTTRFQSANGEQKDTTLTSYKIVGLEDFYYMPLTQKNIDYLQGGNVFAVGGLELDDLKPGDFSLMVACHVTSIEYFENWTWQTFWWSPDPANKPQPSANVKAPFDRYDMEQCYYMIGPDGKPFISQNPYLEPSIIAPIVKIDPFSQGLGVRSNCMSCHHSAAFPTPNVDPNPGSMLLAAYIGAGDVKKDDKFFSSGLDQKRVNTNFMWTLILLKQAAGFSFDPSVPSVDSLQIYLSDNK